LVHTRIPEFWCEIWRSGTFRSFKKAWLTAIHLLFIHLAMNKFIFFILCIHSFVLTQCQYLLFYTMGTNLIAGNGTSRANNMHGWNLGICLFYKQICLFQFL
jgi:hypothetical protein